VLFAASMGLFAIQLDFFSMQAALPQMSKDLDTTINALQWVISGYMLSVASFFIAGGRLADIFGRRTWLLIGAGAASGVVMTMLVGVGGVAVALASAVANTAVLEGPGASLDDAITGILVVAGAIPLLCAPLVWLTGRPTADRTQPPMSVGLRTAQSHHQ
jgi:MFS family permease